MKAVGSKVKSNVLSEIPKDSRSGWLSPGGKFYVCSYGCHGELADSLGKDTIVMENLGWIKLSQGYLLEPKKPLTQKQIDIIFDWCSANNKRMPWWYKEELCET